MKPLGCLGGIVLSATICLGDGLPSITTDPQSQTVVPGANATFTVAALGSTSYQWRFNGVDLAGATASTLTVTNALLAQAGYYLAIAKNSFGSVPSGMAYLSVVDDFQASVPFRTTGNTRAIARYQNDPFGDIITNGTATVVAGPALDQMQPLAGTIPVTNGYLNGFVRYVPTVESGQSAYYRVDITYPSHYYPSGIYTQQSTVLNIQTGGGPSSISNLYFPVWIEWPEPIYSPASLTNQVRILGESFSITNEFDGYTDLGPPAYQWRKDGKEIGTLQLFPINYSVYFLTNVYLTITNCRASDAGLYDVKVLGNNWFISPKVYVSVQVSNTASILLNPRRSGSSFLAELSGVQNRVYKIQWSSNLTSWIDATNVMNNTGTNTFQTSLPPTQAAFYRALLQP